MESTSARSSEQDALLLPPGFRFHPTDEEVITSYLLRKFSNPSFTSLPVGEADLNKCEPWDLPSKARMGEKEWYFFCHKDMKYPTGMRANRATREGYWKATGKDKEIFSVAGGGGQRQQQLVGMKKTLVFYMGRAPRGSKTNWVMHEFRLHGASRDNPNFRLNPKDEWVVCKVFHKKGEAAKSSSSTKAARGAVEYYSSAGATPNASSVDAGDVDDFFLDFMLDPAYVGNFLAPAAAKTTATIAGSAPPYNAGYPSSTSGVVSTSFVDLPNYGGGLINASNQLFAAVANPFAASRNSYGTNEMSLRRDDHQAAMVKALGGAMAMVPNHGVSKGLPISPAMTGASPQNKQRSNGGGPLAAAAAADSTLGPRLVHYY